MIKFENVTKIYHPHSEDGHPTVALDDVSF